MKTKTPKTPDQQLAEEIAAHGLPRIRVGGIFIDGMRTVAEQNAAIKELAHAEAEAAKFMAMLETDNIPSFNDFRKLPDGLERLMIAKFCGVKVAVEAVKEFKSGLGRTGGYGRGKKYKIAEAEMKKLWNAENCLCTTKEECADANWGTLKVTRSTALRYLRNEPDYPERRAKKPD
jgi:hypothetical protein